MPGVRNSHLSIGFDLTTGISISEIRDVAANRPYLVANSLFFEFAVNNQAAFQSDTGLTARILSEASDGSSLSLLARSIDDQLGFQLNATLAPDSNVAVFELTAVNLTANSIFLRVVFPKIRGIKTPGDPVNMMGAIPKEGGSVVPLSDENPWGLPPYPLGMDFIIDVGLPNARNNMEIASIFDQKRGGGVFFCDLDGDLDNGIAPLQFNLSAIEVVGFWIGDIAANSSTILPRLGIGVHSQGDWHKAVDYYTLVHRPRWSFPDTPAWLSEAGAIYTPSGGGAGGIYLALPPKFTLADGAVWNSWEAGDGQWNNGPLQITPAGFVPTGSQIIAIKQNTNQVTVFGASWDGTIKATWESNDGPWHNNRNGLIPGSITPQVWVIPGIPLAAAQQSQDQWNVFFTREDGSLWVTFEIGDGAWTDGQSGRPFPKQIAPARSVPPGANLAAAQESDRQLDLFCIAGDGAIWLWYVVDNGVWSDGVAITEVRMFPPGAPLVAIKQNGSQLNVFAVDHLGGIRTTWVSPGAGWQFLPVAVSPAGLAPAGAYLATTKQTNSQLDVFVVGSEGAVWVTWEEGDGVWTDGSSPGSQPQKITADHLASPGSPLAVATQGASHSDGSPHQLDVFFTGASGGVYVTFEQENGPWSDGQDNRPAPAAVMAFPTLPASGIAAVARNDSHVDVFCTIPGKIKSFLELPSLLAEAQALGTNVLYLNDYWEGVDEGGMSPYTNKGDYIPRLDLGGEEAFIQGIDGVHQFGGKVVLYVEPFIVYLWSIVGQANGESWGGRNELGELWGIKLYDLIYPNYEDYYTMVAPFAGWQNQLVSIAERLVGQYEADGIFLDSYAWQMNRPMRNNANEIFYTAQQYSQGVLDLAGLVRSAIRRIKSNAIVMGETTAGPIARHWDGGLNADFGFGNIWGKFKGPERLIASPVRYGIPEVRMFGNGVDLNGLHQFFAAGHNLALCSNFPGTFMFTYADHIKKLVGIRVTYKDALIYGAQINQPSSSSSAVVAYQYQGTLQRIVTIVSIVDELIEPTITISLDTPDPGGTWTDLVAGRTYTTNNGVFENIGLGVGIGSLLVLLHNPG